MFFDVFNGDADGICALQQLRLHTPCPEAVLVTGVKRDVVLLERLGAVRDSRLTVLDISMARNHDALARLLAQNNRIFYADHHYSGDVPVSEALDAHIDPDPQLCTSLIINRLLKGRYRAWAVVGAFGDNLDEAATAAAAPLHLLESDLALLRESGRLLNYNGYGMAVSELLIHPADLFREVNRFQDPFTLYRHSEVFGRLREGYAADMAQAAELRPGYSSPAGRVFVLPSANWCKRVVGEFANQQARLEPALAHAILITLESGDYLVSVRAPLAHRRGADELCRRFPTGGGRAAAAGINILPQFQLQPFLEAFEAQFGAEK